MPRAPFARGGSTFTDDEEEDMSVEFAASACGGESEAESADGFNMFWKLTVDRFIYTEIHDGRGHVFEWDEEERQRATM